MKIAFDATVVHGRKSGVGYYTQELLRSLVRLEQPDDYFVFSHQPLSSEIVAPVDGVRFSDRRFCPVRAFYLHALLPGLLDKESPDLVHYTNFLAPIGESRPYVVTVHDMSLERLAGHHPVGKRVYTKRLIPHSARGARLILTNSEFSKWDIVRFLGVEEDRIRVTPLAASESFCPTSKEERAPVLQKYGLGRPYFLYVGNIEPRKNLERLLEAFGRVPDESFDLVFAGNARFRGSQVLRKAAALKLHRRVRFLGYVPRHDIPPLMGGATAFVYPSLLEGFGMPVLEAMACGRPVITSLGSALEEVAGRSALLVDPNRIDQITDALVALAEDDGLRETLARKALDRAADFSWKRTAQETHAAYQEVVGVCRRARVARMPAALPKIQESIQDTLSYAALLDYPLTVDELHERLFNVRVTRVELAAALRDSGVTVDNGYVSDNPSSVRTRQQREQWSDRVIEEFRPQLAFLARVPFVRMLAFSGATAHRNMRDGDLDLFAVVEDGKLWAVLLFVTVWAKLKGLRKSICLNYIISDQAMPIFETDAFTAQQMASLRPICGKNVYDRFISVNPFVRRHFPNFNPARQRDFYSEIEEGRLKPVSESLFRFGLVQILEVVSRRGFGAYLEGKRSDAELEGDVAVRLGRKWIKLHLHSHKEGFLERIGKREKKSSLSGRNAVPRLVAPTLKDGQTQHAEVQRR